MIPSFGNDRWGHDDLSLWNLKALGPSVWAGAGQQILEESNEGRGELTC